MVRKQKIIAQAPVNRIAGLLKLNVESLVEFMKTPADSQVTTGQVVFLPCLLDTFCLIILVIYIEDSRVHELGSAQSAQY